VTYLTLRDDTHTVITRSAVHSAHDPKTPNLCASPTFRSGDGEPTVSTSILMSASDLSGLDVESPDLKLPHFSPDELMLFTFTVLPFLSMFFDDPLLFFIDLLVLFGLCSIQAYDPFKLRIPSSSGFHQAWVKCSIASQIPSLCTIFNVPCSSWHTIPTPPFHTCPIPGSIVSTSASIIQWIPFPNDINRMWYAYGEIVSPFITMGRSKPSILTADVLTNFLGYHGEY
jgi:hypothetical protein